ncbi:hypothetical protein E2C01_100780 [Portunus trituberculatus]|uniref:Uncharacterized protein n=1 Tax=Portunus trituberculatus TaxID=210409 RepID=A0A5B7KIE8_PORTR|nr:hypothetical protein [Portunus trituberculatus]
MQEGKTDQGQQEDSKRKAHICCQFPVQLLERVGQKKWTNVLKPCS